MESSTLPYCPLIDPVPDDRVRPFWSVMVPTYNGTAYLEQTLRSVLEQDPGAAVMHIEVIDDCSTEDDPEPLVQLLGNGRITFHRQLQNQGQIKTWNNCIQRATGKWIHILHQDDFVLPGFYQSLQVGLSQDSTVGAAFCRHRYINEQDQTLFTSLLERESSGILADWLKQIATMQRIQFPSIVVKREIYEQIGGFCPQARSAADWEMWTRIAAYFSIWYEPQTLACFRLHSSSESSRLIKTGRNIADTRCAIEIAHSYLPRETAYMLTSKAKEYYAIDAFNRANKLRAIGDLRAAIAQLQEGLKCQISPKTLKHLAHLTKQNVSRFLSSQT
ncbi:MAG: glycosyltransferase [Timaviella obliquedivisa GSE-PSE-MK23-08B]|jgi:glycosyltransferase involved in cell wall biosynthesis|nr:glycosyltransferase [Timaviella obliquedivisa GSE-PSE-MK23-08B]